MKFVIKLPVSVKGKFKIQSRGNIVGRQYATGAGVLGWILTNFSGTGLKEKTAIVIKEYIDGHFENINETLSSNDREYLLYCTTCFLENHISESTLRKAEKRWTEFLSLGRVQK